MLLWFDGFQDYGSTPANLTAAGYSISGTPVFDTTIFRTGITSLKLNNASISRPVEPTQTLAAGAAFRLASLPAPTKVHELFCFRNAADDPVFTICVDSTGAILAKRGSVSGTLLGTTTAKFAAGAWRHVEVRVFVDATNGEIDVRVNGVSYLSSSAVNTGTDPIESLSVNQGSPGDDLFDKWIDDFFVWDDSGTDNNDFLGDMKVEYGALADGAEQDWLVSDPPAYIMSNTVGDVTSFDADGVTRKNVIAGLMVKVVAKRDAEGPASIQTAVDSGGTEGLGDEVGLSTSYQAIHTILEEDPDTNEAWTVAGVNAIVIKVERTA